MYIDETGVSKLKAVRRRDADYAVNLVRSRRWFAGEDESGGGNDENSGEDNGTATANIDWSTIDPNSIPDDVLKKTSGYQKLLEESIQRRKKLSAGKQTTENKKPKAQKPADEVEDDENESEDTDRTDPVISELRNQIAELQKDRLTNFKIMAASRVGLDPTNKSHMRLIEGNNLEEMMTSAKEVAKDLGIDPEKPKIRYNPDGTAIPANPSGTQKDSTMSKRIRDRITGNIADNPFDTGRQRMTGGGVFINEFDGGDYE
jgi:hypothetical protein